MSDFTHLHVHTQYSLLDGTAKIDELLDSALSLGFDSLAITDHGVMYGAVEFCMAAQKRGIKPILGCEVYTAPHSRFGRLHGTDSNYGHLVLLCENNTGYKNLMTLVSLGFTEGYYYKPRVDEELLEKYSEGLIALSGCLKGDVSSRLACGDFDGALAKARRYAEIFGTDNFFLEIQDHGIPEQKIVIDGMIKISKLLGLALVATNDVHYIKREDSLLQDVLTCIQTGKRLSDTDRLKFFGQEFYLKSADEMKVLFENVPSALENTVKIAKRCNASPDFNTVHLPKINIETDLSHEEYLKDLCLKGAVKKYGELTNEVLNRIETELSVINSMGYTDYFLIVWDFIKYARDRKIPVGPGRGSAAGSIVAYTLDITQIDPLRYDLLFERFLNPERVSMPDIDIDICNERRDEVKNYVSEKYGATRVAGIVAFGTLAARAAIRDVGRVLGTDIQTVDRVSKSVPEVLHIKLKDALESEPALKQMYLTDSEVKKLLDVAMQLEGFVRNATTHAAGVVIADDELFNYTPVQTGDKGLISQYSMAGLEAIGLLKMDFLGLRNLTIIDNTLKLIKENRGIDISLENFDYNDKKTFVLIQKGDTNGVFQLENPGLKSFLRKFKPKCVDDIITTTSIYRPGPMEQIPQFLKNVKEPQNIKYMHPLLEDILRPTYGVIVYQEQVMKIVQTLAGYSMGRADLVRRQMAKKKKAEMEKERLVFINGIEKNGKVIVRGTRRNGIDDETANKIFDTLIHFANYAFNKSHAACYAHVAYQTAYLKANYPTEYLAALLASLLGNSHKISKYVTDFSKYKIRLLPPDINKSTGYFDVEGTNVRFGLSALKNVGMTFPKNIVKERLENGNFKSFEDFAVRMSKYDLNKRSVEVLIRAGAFDSVFKNRRALLMNYESLIDDVKSEGMNQNAEQVSFFAPGDAASSKILVPDTLEDFTSLEKLAFEHEYAGMYLSGHPVNEYLLAAAAFSDTQIYEINDGGIDEGERVNICAVVSHVSARRTKNGIFLCTMTLSDLYDSIELTAFEKSYKSFATVLKDGAALCVSAQVKKRNDTVSLSLVSATDAASFAKTVSGTLYLRIADKAELAHVSSILSEFHGKSSVCIYFEDSAKVVKSDENHGCLLCNELVEKLCETIGLENIRIVRKD